MDNFWLYLKIFFSIATSLATSFSIYHKFLMKELDKKMDKEDCGRQQELLSQKRKNLETLIVERTKTIFKQQEEIKQDVKLLLEKVIEK